MIRRLKATLVRWGVTRAVAYGTLARLASAALSLVTALLIASRFTPSVQGYYYTFNNLLALQAFAELGLGPVIIQFASHLWSQLGFDPRGGILGDPKARSQLISLARFAMVWYLAAGLLVGVGLSIAGGVFFSRTTTEAIAWRGPWLALCVMSGVKLTLSSFLFLLEGCNAVQSVYMYRMGAALVVGTSLTSAVAGGLALWAGACATSAEVLWTLLFLVWRHRRFVAALFETPGGHTIDWRHKVLPVQMRFAASWVCGYFIYWLFAPVLFVYAGAARAGEWGMTWSMCTLVASVSSLWIVTWAPQFGIWIARKEYGLLDAQFSRQFRITLTVAAAGSVAIGVFIWGLQHFGYPLGRRLLVWPISALLAASFLLVQVSQAWSVYLRAHAREPLLGISLVQAVLTTLSTLVLGRLYGAAGMAAGYLAVIVCVVIPITGWTWMRYKRLWHSESAAHCT